LKSSNYDKFPVIKAYVDECITGWDTIVQNMLEATASIQTKTVIAIECYHGVNIDEIRSSLVRTIKQADVIDTATAFKSEEEINKMVYPYVTDDPVFGYITPLALKDFFDNEKVGRLKTTIESSASNLILIIGAGASLIAEQPALLIYADMPRWEIQLRFRKQAVPNLGVNNSNAGFSYLYKRAFFVDWRVCDRQKKSLKNRINFWLDTTKADEPKLATAAAINQALASAVHQPFRVVPFFDPGPWGGQWLKEEFDLDRSEKNFAWGFDCVPEENSLLIEFKNEVFEIPSINLVFDHPQELLGEKVYQAFGDEFPIRFDFLDTMQGGNLSLQVHPLMEYIREKFGMGYTQDESYYFLEAADDAFVYLGLKENIVPEKMIAELESAQAGNGPFEAEQYVEKWPIKKHDHILIPAGTVHCSGANSVVLEISATPYIFTFKLWDWGRMGLDGKPRPISIAHGKNVIQWQRTTEWTRENLVNKFEPITEGDGWREERTGLSTTSFIETRRHWFTRTVQHNTAGVVNVLNLIEGREAIVQSPSNAFEPFIIHYAETFIVPAAVGAYTITPHGESLGKQCATIKASVRTNNLKNYRIN
jgi:mannose-6-phosphate isomerase class I